MVKEATKTSMCLVILHCVIRTGLTLPISTEFPGSIHHHDDHVTSATSIHNNNYTQEITTSTTEDFVIDVTRGLENTGISHDQLDLNTGYINEAVSGFYPHTTRQSLKSSEDIGSVKLQTTNSFLESGEVIESFVQQTTDNYIKSHDDIERFHSTEFILKSSVTPLNEIPMGSKQTKTTSESESTMAYLTIGTVETTSELPKETTENHSGSNEQGDKGVEKMTTLAAHGTIKVSVGTKSLLKLLTSETDSTTTASLTISGAGSLIEVSTVSPPSNLTLSKHKLRICRRLAQSLEADTLFVFEDLFRDYSIDALAALSKEKTIPQSVLQKLENAKDLSVVIECLQIVYDILYGYGSDMRDFGGDEYLEYVRDNYCSLRKNIRQLIHPNTNGDCTNHHANNVYVKKDSVETAETLAALYRLSKQIEAALKLVKL